MQIPQEFIDYAYEAGQAYGVDPDFLLALAATESSFNPNAVSEAGAQGLMQFMPGTAEQYGIDPMDPRQAMHGAARHIMDLSNQFGGDPQLILNAYNAGAGRVQQYGGPVPFAETQQHYQKTMDTLEQIKGSGAFKNSQATMEQWAGEQLNPATQSAMADISQYLSYSNQGATRNKPLTQSLEQKLATAGRDLGLNFKVFSGGQTGDRRTGSIRHDDGKAGDVYVYKDGKQLTGDALVPVARYWIENGFGSAGLEMKGGGLHLDEWTQDQLQSGMAIAWGYGTPTPEQQALIGWARGGKWNPASGYGGFTGAPGQAGNAYAGGFGGGQAQGQQAQQGLLSMFASDPQQQQQQSYLAMLQAQQKQAAPKYLPTPESKGIGSSKLARLKALKWGNGLTAALPTTPGMPRQDQSLMPKTS